MKTIILSIALSAILTSCESTGGTQVPTGTKVSGTVIVGYRNTTALGTMFAGTIVEDVIPTK